MPSDLYCPVPRNDRGERRLGDHFRAKALLFPIRIKITTLGKLSDKIQDMGELKSEKEREVGEFMEFVLYALRGFRTFHVMIGVGVYGDNLESAIRKQPGPTREVLFRKGIPIPLTSKLGNLPPVVLGKRMRPGVSGFEPGGGRLYRMGPRDSRAITDAERKGREWQAG